ncbi:MAG: Gfo/Idh/MocA family oxidoreductase [Clostridia bacterium]|nr:Gfo/Idh/MocA family oxidoreductase [Clostridia bacterium]
MKQLTVALIGAGGRGTTYVSLMDKEKFKVVAVAEPIKERRDRIKDRFGIPENMCFETYEPLLERPKLADCAVIATSDKGHFEPAMKAIEKGYDLLLEKPVAPTCEECVKIAALAKEKGVKILVCHVLRYTKFYSKIKEMIKNGAVGKVVSIDHSENVGNLHQSHSFVRGNWGNTEKSSNMLLAKSCHDIDIIQWLMDEKCVKVQSFGSLYYFRPENAPEGAPEYCIEGCPHSKECLYDATVIYSKEHKGWYKRHALQKDDPTDEDYEKLLKTTQYGKCVFKCDNDVVDHQVVNMEFESGATASFSMCAFNEGGRYIRVMGTKGEIYGSGKDDILDFFDFRTREHTIIKPNETSLDDSITNGHGGGDGGIVATLYEYLVNGYKGDMLSEIGISTENHLIVFAAEESRLKNKVVNMKEFYKETGFVSE